VDGNAWVVGSGTRVRDTDDVWGFEKSRVSGKPRVSGKARVTDDAVVFGNARVDGDTWVVGDRWLAGRRKIEPALRGGPGW
jgi:hypothetical protein